MVILNPTSWQDELLHHPWVSNLATLTPSFFVFEMQSHSMRIARLWWSREIWLTQALLQRRQDIRIHKVNLKTLVLSHAAYSWHCYVQNESTGKINTLSCALTLLLRCESSARLFITPCYSNHNIHRLLPEAGLWLSYWTPGFSI